MLPVMRNRLVVPPCNRGSRVYLPPVAASTFEGWPADTGHLYSDIGATTPVTNGGTVAVWRNTDGVQDLTQSSSGARPTYSAADRAVVFDGVDDTLSGNTPASFTVVTIAAWVKTGSTSSSYPVVFGTNDATDMARIGQTPNSDNNKLFAEIRGDGGTVQVYSTVPANSGTDGSWHRAVFVASGGAASLYLDGSILASASGSWGTVRNGLMAGLTCAARPSNYLACSLDQLIFLPGVAWNSTQVATDYADNPR